ncbi:MAG: hypothetical protein HOD85_17830 [Deltaproteobacteria bacterium]|nr:hypothetical protein [Deltaproteobacteria bacterium]
MAAALHATYDYFIFLNKSWTLCFAVVLTWALIIILHFYLRRIQALRPFSRPNEKVPESENTSMYSNCGKHPAVLAKAIYLSDDSAKKLDRLRVTKKQQTGNKYNRSQYMQLIISGMFQLMKSEKLNLDLRFLKICSEKRKYCSIESSKSVMLSYSCLTMLDEIRQYIKKRSGHRYTRDQYLLGIINGLYHKTMK